MAGTEAEAETGTEAEGKTEALGCVLPDDSGESRRTGQRETSAPKWSSKTRGGRSISIRGLPLAVDRTRH